MIPSLYPIYDFQSATLNDGSEVAATTLCRANLRAGKCSAYYESLRSKAGGYFQCPYGFTTRTFLLDGHRWAVTGVIAFPRFGSAEEQRRGKLFPKAKVARATIEQSIAFLQEASGYKVKAVEEAAKVLPQAFHELRKLNRAVLQHAEREISERGDSRNLASIKSAAELMRNNFDILEALSNIDGIRALPMDDTINLFDLAFKMKRVYQEKGGERSISINVNGVRAIVRGSQKSFPIVPAVLVENALKYGVPSKSVRMNIAANGAWANLTVENETDFFIDPVKCFERGERYADQVEGGGFGLFLAREIVEAHKGTIACEPAGRLVRMIVRLPLVTVIA